jgi:hypothetical protein
VIRRAALVIMLVARAAAADPVDVLDGQTRWQIDLPAGFAAEEPEPLGEGTMLARFADDAGRRVVVARLRGNTDGAYDGTKAYFAGLEEGVKRQSPGYKRLVAAQRKLGAHGKIPGYDLWYRTGEAVRGSRFALLRGYALVVTVHLPGARRIDRSLKKALESFGPR